MARPAGSIATETTGRHAELRHNRAELRWVEPGAVRVVLELGHGKDRRTFEQQAVVVPGSPLEVVFAYPRQE